MLTQMVKGRAASTSSVITTASWSPVMKSCRRSGTVRGFIADEDIRLAIQFLVSDAYLNGHTGQWLETAAVRHLLFPLQEHTL
ncbi:hypothetical protein [Klebsiella quasipneumoniae]|uniref:hypothetical protein n=1 Tax=Klebsiella quasipneumoniae TaxID=1463165 RepID=UPI00388D0B71